MTAVAIADYGAGNLRSVVSALRRAGVEPSITADPATVATARLTVIAGVGTVEAAARGLRAAGLDDALRQRVVAGRPTFGICVGMQVLFDRSDEGGSGLGLLAGPVRRLRAQRVPHMGWNTIATVRSGSALLDAVNGADMYFAHSFAVEPTATRVVAATTEHGGPVVAAIEDGPLAGVQFHPERSGAAGAQLIEGMVTWSRSV